MTFEEVKADYIEIVEKHGFPSDMTGGFSDAAQMEKVIRNPTKANAKKYMLNVIAYGFQVGEFWNAEAGDKYNRISINECETVKRIYEKYMA